MVRQGFEKVGEGAAGVIEFLQTPVGEKNRYRPRGRSRAAVARGSQSATDPTGIGDALVAALRAIGASVISTLGLAGSMLLIGSAVLWVRFDEAGLPATQALEHVPERQVLIEGVHALALPVIVALVAVLFVYALDPPGKRNLTWGSIFATVLLTLGAIAWTLASLSGRTAVGLVVLAIILLLASFGVARASEDRFLPFAAAIFISATIFTAALNVTSEAADKTVQPAAVLRGPDGLGLFGFYVADTEDAIYLGLVRDGHEPKRGDPLPLYTIPREEDTRLLIGPAMGWDSALAEACELRSQLKSDWKPNPACGNFEAPLAQYLALGDSYSSGEGAPPFDLGESCHRSSSGWPTITATNADNLTATRAVNLACSGATIDDLSSNFKGDPPQLNGVGRGNDLITITIGGNDAGFSSVLKRCFLTACTNSGPVKAAGRVINQVLPGRLQDLYAKIIAKSGEDTRVIVVGYPRIFPADFDKCFWLSDKEREALNGLSADLEEVIARAAERADVEHVDVTDVLDGHELCSKEPWMNAIKVKLDFRDTTRGHPTKDGQQAIAAAVTAHVDG